MVNKCSVPGCRGNYDSENKVHVFSFPRDTELKNAWIRAIPRKDIIYTKNSRVCEKHFTPENIEWESSAFDEKKGQIITAPLKKLRLNKKAVPSIFPGCPSYLSKETSETRESPNKKRMRQEDFNMKQAVEASLKSKQDYEMSRSFKDLEELQVLEKCPEGIKDIYLPSLYEHLTHKSFNLHELGYSSILDLVDALPHIFKRVLDPEEGKNWVILPAATKTKHFSNGVCSKRPVGIPADAASPSLQFIKAAIPQNISLNQYIPVFLYAIKSPDLFWFQLQTEDTAKKFEAFENDIGDFYDYHAGSRYVMHDSDIAIGSTCVVRHPKDRKWYRAIIKAIPNIKSINVSFVDYGSRENVPRSNVYYVRNKYEDYPAQAFKAQLACLRPAKSAKTWDARAVQRFIQLCECPILMAHINQIDEDTFSVHLCNISGELDVHIGDTLINEGFAELCLENVDKSYLESDCKESVSDGISSDRESYFSSESNEHTQNGTREITSESDAEIFNVKGKLVVSPQKELDSFKANTLHSEQIQGSKRFVKQVDLCEEHRIHVINLEDKLYMTCSELSRLLWKDKDSSFLIERLKYKDVNIPFIKISKESNVSLFKQCICCKIPEYEKLKPSNSSLILYPLESAFEVLNVFGYPFPGLRLVIKNEILSYDPSDPVWNEFSYEEFAYFSDTEKCIEEELSKLCLYDLKAKNEALQIQKLKLLRIKNDSTSEEIKNIDCMQKVIERRMKKIEDICSQYSSL